jgi:ankyrin repeat protein
VEGAKLKLKDPLPLHFSVYIDRLRISEILIDAGANVNAKDEKRGWTAMHYAAFLNDTNHIRLLQRKGASLNLQGNAGVSFVFMRPHFMSRSHMTHFPPPRPSLNSRPM